MFINDLIKELIEIAEFEGNLPISISVGFDTTTLTGHLEPPHDKIWITGWHKDKYESPYTPQTVDIQNQLEV